MTAKNKHASTLRPEFEGSRDRLVNDIMESLQVLAKEVQSSPEVATKILQQMGVVDKKGSVKKRYRPR